MPEREVLAQQIRELTRLIGQASGYDSILCTHNMRITSRNSGPCQGHDNQERRIRATKLRVWRGCQGCRGGRRVKRVGPGAGAGEEPQPGPFAELGEQVAGLDLEPCG